MKDRIFRRTCMVLMLLIAVIATGGLIGCAGDDGSQGPAGPAGPAGPGSQAASEQCTLCHNGGNAIAFGPYHPDKLTAALSVSNIVVSSSATGTPIVTFSIGQGTLAADGTVTGVTPSTTFAASNVRIYIADLVPAGTVTSPTGTVVPNLTGTLSSDYFETWAAERNTTAGAVFTNLGAGNYSWTFSTVWGTPTTTGLNAADIDTTVGTGHTQRVYLRLSNPNSAVYAKGAAGTVDFKVPANSAAATPLTSQRVMVTIEACWECHSTTLLGAAHGGGYVDTKGCVVCHSPLYATNGTDQTAGFMAHYSGDPDVEPYHNYVFPDFIHHIHNAMLGFEEVTYPQAIKKCDVCHQGTGDQIDNWKNHPTRLACGSCHDTVVFASGLAYTGIKGTAKAPHPVQTTDAGCTGCHSAIGAPAATDIVTAHSIVPAPLSPNEREFDVTLTLTPPAGAFYVSGETVTVTATLVTFGTASPVAGTVYTTPQGAAGASGGGLRVASLYLYGPRSLPLPLTGTQANSLLAGGTNPNVKTDATGFKYRWVVPSGLANGTYMVRFRAGDYGRVNDTNYRIESTKFQTIQIGTATVQTKLDGDMCVKCHGDGTLPAHDARHAVVFNSDECVACHDFSGGHADALANRVHAIHAASAHGDLLDSVSSALSWTHVTYPQGSMGTSSAGISTGAKICVSCHTSGNTDYKNHAPASACYGCHGDNALVVDHMLQFGGPVK